MTGIDDDRVREERIQNEAIVDCYGEYELAAGWYCYLEDRMTFPFKAKCNARRSISPLQLDDMVDVLQMASQDDCMHEMYVQIRFLDRLFGVPLAQLTPLDVDDQTQEASADWQYWVGRGYMF